MLLAPKPDYVDIMLMYDNMSYTQKVFWLVWNFPGRDFGTISSKEIYKKLTTI